MSVIGVTRKRKKNNWLTNKVNICEVGILIYYYTLTMSIHLHKLTVAILREKMFSYEDTQSSRKAIVHSLGGLKEERMHLDEDDAYANIDE